MQVRSQQGGQEGHPGGQGERHNQELRHAEGDLPGEDQGVRSGPGVHVRRRHGDGNDRQTGDLRHRRRPQPVRGHPHGSGRAAPGRSGDGRQREHQPRGGQHVRAHPRLRSGHRRKGHSQPHRRRSRGPDALGGAGVSGRGQDAP